ncbi:hypothetical protein LUR56_31095 [Streptomyces sp. MT29]|nr:hypothetical protein [Streptomyces sp. MT29]
MNAVLTLETAPQTAALVAGMRTVQNSSAPTDIPREQTGVYRFNLLAGKTLRESYVLDANGSFVLVIRFAEYIDPVTRSLRYAADYWSVNADWAVDHAFGAVAELAYEKAVRDEFAAPTLPGSIARFTRGLASFYDVTDVL